MICKNIKEGIDLYLIKDDKFKTANISVNFTRPLSRQETTFNASLPMVLRRGCRKFPDTLTLNTYLDKLYGAEFICNVSKLGESQRLIFNFRTISDRYTENAKPFSDLIDLMSEALLNPLAENGKFNDEFVKREKENLKQLIESIQNDKKEYAKKRLIETMYQNSNYGIFEYGYSEDLEKINSTNLYVHYKKVINESPISIFVTGNFDEKEVSEKLIRIFAPLNKRNATYPEISADKFSDKVKYISESEQITQGKLSMGFFTDITCKSPLYYAMLVANNLFGGSPHSKLFLNVREKMSLAYYAGSVYSKYKGFINVNCGIEFDKYEVTVKEVINQLELMKHGNVTEEETEFSKLAIINALNSSKDSLKGNESFYVGQMFSGSNKTINEEIAEINKITAIDVIEAIKTVKPAVVFFLKGCEE